MKLRVYIETSVISAYFDARTPERMAQTRFFWKILNTYEPVISQHVRDELSGIKESELKYKILKLVEDLSILAETAETLKLAKEYISKKIFPEKYLDDALHQAIATVNGCHILVSWNFQHLVKRKTRIEANLVNSQLGYSTIDINAPPEL